MNEKDFRIDSALNGQIEIAKMANDLEVKLDAALAQLAERDKEIAMLRDALEIVIYNVPCNSMGYSKASDAISDASASTAHQNYIHTDKVKPLAAALKQIIRASDGVQAEGVDLQEACEVLAQYKQLTGE